jgi:hypothetical protein
VLGQRHFFKPRAHIKRDNILRRHLVIEDKHHRNKPFDDGRIAVARSSIAPSSFVITIHTWLWQP